MDPQRETGSRGAAGPWIWRDEPREDDVPLSEPVLVLSGRVRDFRYVGRMHGRDFHVVFQQLVMCTGTEDTPLCRSLRRRLLPGWQLWKESFSDCRGRHSLDCLTFDGARDFLRALLTCELPREVRRKIEAVQPAFAGDGPEGILYPVPPLYAWDLSTRRIPGTPCRALAAGRTLFPLIETDLGRERWLSLWLLCRWYCLDYPSARGVLLERRGEFQAREWAVTGFGRRKFLHLPLAQGPEALQALGAHWRSRGFPCGGRALELASLLDARLMAERDGKAAPSAVPMEAMPLRRPPASADPAGAARDAAAASRGFQGSPTAQEEGGLPGRELSGEGEAGRLLAFERRLQALQRRVELLESRGAAAASCPAP